MTKAELKRIKNALKHQCEVSIKFGGNIIVIGTYKNTNTSIEYYCIKHDEYFFAMPSKMIAESRKGCSVCSEKTNWTTEFVIKRIQYLNRDEFGNNTLMIDEFVYQNLNQEIWLTCLIDRHRWKVLVGNLIHRRSGCPRCMFNLSKLTIEEFFNRIPSIFLNENGNPLHKYNLRNFNGAGSIIKIFDPDYGWFEKRVDYYLLGRGHPNAPKCKSKGELVIQDFLLANQIKFIREHTLSKTKLRFDFFVPDQNLAIEYDGPQHLEYDPWIHRNDYSNFEKQQQNDRKKDQWCQDNGIMMIRITNITDILKLLNFLSIEK